MVQYEAFVALFCVPLKALLVEDLAAVRPQKGSDFVHDR